MKPITIAAAVCKITITYKERQFKGLLLNNLLHFCKMYLLNMFIICFTEVFD